MKRLICALVLSLCFSFQAQALTVERTNEMLNSGKEELQKFATTYLAVVIKSFHDMDMYHHNTGMIRTTCISDGFSQTDEGAAHAAKQVWNQIIEDAQVRDDDAVLGKEVTIAIIEWTQREHFCGPEI